MVQTYFNLDNNYIINHYRFKPIKDGLLLTNDFGSWVYLDKNEFTLLRHGNLNQNQALLSLLKDKGVILAENNLDKVINDFRLRSMPLFRGTYHHAVYLNTDSLKLENIDENTKKITDFILQTPSREAIVKFKGNILENFEIVKSFINEFKENHNKKIMFEIETDLNNFNDDIIEFLINNKFDVWIVLKYMNLSDEVFKFVKELQRRHRVIFYIDISRKMLGEEQKIIDFFVENNLTSFFIRKTKDITKDEFTAFWKKIIDDAYEANKKSGRIAIQELYASTLLRKITSINDVFYHELSNLCTGTIINQLAYNLKGEVYANEESVGIELFKLGDVNSSYSDIVSSDDSLALLGTSLIGDAALEINAYKPYISSCPVCNYLEFSNIISHHTSQRTLILIEILDYLFEKILFDKEFLKHVLPI